MAASQQAAIFSGNVGIFDLSGSFDDLARMPIVVFFAHDKETRFLEFAGLRGQLVLLQGSRRSWWIV
jgi:hypothetical protein